MQGRAGQGRAGQERSKQVVDTFQVMLDVEMMENWCNEYEIDAVDGEQSDVAFWGIGGTTRVSSKHMGRHVGGEVIDDHLKFCKENIRSRLGFDAHKDIEHATGMNDQLRNHTGNRLGLT